MKETKLLSTISGSNLLGIILGLLQSAVSIALLLLIIYLNIFPIKYVILCAVVLVLLAAYVIYTQFTRNFKGFGKFLSLIFIILILIGLYMLLKTSNVINHVTGADKKTDVISVYVLKDDPAQNLSDAKTYTFGFINSMYYEQTKTTIDGINKILDTNITVVEYSDIESMISDFYNKKVQALIMNEAFPPAIEEITNSLNQRLYPFFSIDTKILSSTIFQSTIETGSSKKVTKEPFVIYLSGIDVAGKISTTSRSDVNILAIVNPNTRQILLLSTPRDYYIPTTVSGGVPDKLTHAGIYGIDCSMGTLGMLYGIDINYYFRINFTGFEKVIDAMGNITVYSDYSFTTSNGNHQIKVGENTLNGAEALGFARERYAFSDGDRQRGRNQMEVISAVFKKACSPAILNSYASLMDGLSDSFETSMSQSEISSFVKMQLDDMKSWNIVSYSVSGSANHKTTYSMPRFTSWVMQPDQTYIDNAKTLINQVLIGETIDKSILKETINY